MTNNKERRPLEHYSQIYSRLGPEAVTARCGAPFNTEKGVFSLSFLTYPILISWPQFSVSCLDSSCPRALLDANAAILSLRYLTEGIRAPGTGAFLSYRELPWGEVYDANFRGRCIGRLARAFGSDTDAFSRACEALGGTPIQMGDTAYELPVFEELKLRLALYRGDEEFGPSSQFLFSDNTPLAFSAEDVAVLGDVIVSALREKSK